VQQADTLEVTTGGIDAAASTGTGVTFVSVGPTAPIDFDRPYLFLVRDTKIGMILFSSVVNDPAGP
jgi:serpin B